MFKGFLERHYCSPGARMNKFIYEREKQAELTDSLMNHQNESNSCLHQDCYMDTPVCRRVLVCDYFSPNHTVGETFFQPPGVGGIFQLENSIAGHTLFNSLIEQ